MVTIYKNFADNFHDLNESLCTDDMVMTEAGRAYLKQDSTPHFGNVHYQPVSEDWLSHQLIQMAFLTNEDHQGGVYAGTAGCNNLTYMAAGKASAAILYDINPYQTVFWKHFIEELARHDSAPKFVRAMQNFAPNFYTLLRDEFNLSARQSENPGLHAASPDPKDHIISVEQQIAEAQMLDDFIGEHTGPPSLKEQARRAKFRPVEPSLSSVLEKSSPFKNDSYKSFANWFRICAGEPETGWLRGGVEELEWLSEPALYTHLHLMAKHGAITPVTIDIACEASMKELAERLENVRYRPVVMDKDTPQIRPLARGAKIDALYLSNTLHYLHWTDKEIQNYKQKHNETPTDFAGRAVNAGTCDQVCRNLRAITADTARIIRFDKYNLRGAGLADFDCTFPFTSCDPAKIKIPGPLDPAGLMPDTI